MPVTTKKTVVRLEGVCTVEEADTLLEWLREHPKGKVNLKDLTQIHAALLQVLMALKPSISAAPDDESLAGWLMPAITSQG